MKSNSSKGFTLIELLVVIAIIGILSAVVLASLNSARSKGNDAGIKANLNTVGTQAALYVSDTNSYGTFEKAACPTDVGTTVFHDPTIQKAIAAALVDSGGGEALCVSTGSAYAIAVSRPAEVASTTSEYWCVDSSSERCGIDEAVLTGGVCDTCITRQ
jgi:prepilin-type N-terminal cleavage/methylation domain-containing protein